MGLFEGLSVPARQVLVDATKAASAMGSHEVEGAHLLVGLLDGDGTDAHMALRSHLPERERAMAETRRSTLPSRHGAHPGFGDEVCLTLATARGIAVGRGIDVVGTGALLLGLLTLLPRSVDDVLSALGADRAELLRVASCCDDTAEPTGPPSGAGMPWVLTVGAAGADGWDDHR